MNPRLKEWTNQPPLGKPIGNTAIISNNSSRTAWWIWQVKTTHTRLVTKGYAPVLESWQRVPVALEFEATVFWIHPHSLSNFISCPPPVPASSHLPLCLLMLQYTGLLAVLTGPLSPQGLCLGWNILPQMPAWPLYLLLQVLSSVRPPLPLYWKLQRAPPCTPNPPDPTNFIVFLCNILYSILTI